MWSDDLFGSSKPERLFEMGDAIAAVEKMDSIFYNGKVDDATRLAYSMLRSKYDSWLHRKALSHLIVLLDAGPTVRTDAAWDRTEPLSSDLKAAAEAGR